MEKIRNSNFELMRIVSMLLIVVWHVIIHGNVIVNCMTPAIKIVLQILLFLIIVHVNSFIILSGYFQSKSAVKVSKIIKLLLQVIFYSILILIISIRVGWIENYTIVTIINNIGITSLNNYWFIKMYLIMYIFSDYINKFIDRLSRKEYKNFIMICFVMLSVIPFLTGHRVIENNGYTFFNFIFIYMIGGYLRRYPLKETYHFKNMSLNGYRIFLICGFLLFGFSNFLLNYFATQVNGASSLLNEFSVRISATYLNYSTPFVIIQTILYFEFFKTLTCKMHWANKVSGLMFGIYLLHDNEIVRSHLYKIIKIDNGLFEGYTIFLKIILASLSIFLVCLCIEWIRKIICTKLYNLKITKNCILKLKQFINSFHCKISW